MNDFLRTDDLRASSAGPVQVPSPIGSERYSELVIHDGGPNRPLDIEQFLKRLSDGEVAATV